MQVHPWTEAIFALLGPSYVTEVANNVNIGTGIWLPKLQAFAGIQWVF